MELADLVAIGSGPQNQQDIQPDPALVDCRALAMAWCSADVVMILASKRPTHLFMQTFT